MLPITSKESAILKLRKATRLLRRRFSDFFRDLKAENKRSILALVVPVLSTPFILREPQDERRVEGVATNRERDIRIEFSRSP